MGGGPVGIGGLLGNINWKTMTSQATSRHGVDVLVRQEVGYCIALSRERYLLVMLESLCKYYISSID